MTTLVGVVYPDGLVMASDLLGKYGSERRIETKKLYSKNGIVIGYGGVFERDFHYTLEEKVSNLLSRYSIPELLVRELAKFNSRLNLSMKIWGLSNYLRSLGGAYIEGFKEMPYVLFTDKGRGNPLWGSAIELLVLHYLVVGVGPGVDFTSPNQIPENESQALELAISVVGEINKRYPERSSGLEVIQVTREETKRVLFEPILK